MRLKIDAVFNGVTPVFVLRVFVVGSGRVDAHGAHHTDIPAQLHSCIRYTCRNVTLLVAQV